MARVLARGRAEGWTVGQPADSSIAIAPRRRAGRTVASAVAAVSVLAPVSALASAWPHAGTRTTSVATAGTLQAWGSNRSGDLGDGTTENRDVPVPVRLPAGTKVVMARAGRDHSLALTSAGHVLAWGGNMLGQLGDVSSATAAGAPATFRCGSGCRKAPRSGQSARGASSTSHLPQPARCWPGDATTTGHWATAASTRAARSRSGSGCPPPSRPLPSLRASSGRVTEVACGNDHALAFTSRGIVLGWGLDDAGQLGNGNGHVGETVPTPTPISMPTGDIVTGIAAGFDQSFAVTSAGQALAWGLNEHGQLGIGNFSTTGTPSPVMLASGTVAVALGAGPEAMHGFAVSRVSAR
ncbi:MAG TPA: hypothetical protein VF834_05765 [Streptosporangiaceae bacterium]